MKALIASIALLLSACSNQQADVAPIEEAKFSPTKGMDGYLFEQSEFEAKSAEIRIFRHKTYDSLLVAWNKSEPDRPIALDKILLGFAYFHPYGSKVKCDIHIIDPKVEYRPEVIGHEFVHCINGNFHPNIGP